MKAFKLKEIAEQLKLKLIGNPNIDISGLKGIGAAQEGDITFLAHKKYFNKLSACQASAIILGKDIEIPEGFNVLLSENPRLDFARLMTMAFPAKIESQIVSDSAIIDKSSSIGAGVTVYSKVYIGKNSKIGKNTALYPGVYIGDEVVIGENCVVHSNCSINDNSIIGNRVFINANSVIGSDGFGFERDGERHYKIPQLGNVIIEDDVEIGSMCCIDRGSFDSTIIGKGTKMDNQVHIAHNCRIGENNLMVAQCAIAGSVKTGKNVYFGGKSGVTEHVVITDRVIVATKAAVIADINEPGFYAGFPARPHPEWVKASAAFYDSDVQRKRMMELEERLKKLEDNEK